MSTANPHSQNVPAGGPATINGVLYQLLWSLLHVSRAHVIEVSQKHDGAIEKTTLTLEPIGGGGDLVVGTASGKVVEQVKARTDGGTWSLKEIIEDVIPDLYIASCDDSSESEFRFVTEGRMGHWGEVYTFFQTLRSNCPSDDTHLPDLDNVTPLRFRGTRRRSRADSDTSDSFWEYDTYTQALLFEKIVTEVRRRSSLANESVDRTRRRMWRLLSRFTFVGGQSMQDVQAQIDAFLFALVDHRERIPDIRDAMAFDLGRRATRGSATINASEFLREHNLNVVALDNWSLFRSQAERYVDDFLAHHRYVQGLDVRFEYARAHVSQWAPTRPVFLITGESGQGKSWRSYALTLALRSLPCVTVIVDSAGSLDATLERAAQTLWNKIGNHDGQIPFLQIVRRVQHVLANVSNTLRDHTWLTLVIDGIQDPTEAQQLTQQPWEQWGVRTAITCGPHLASQLEQDSPLRCASASVCDFRVQELQEYLTRSIGDEWTTIPEYIRQPLSKPLLAQIYCRLVEETRLQPTTEYELYQAFWDRLRRCAPFDELALKKLGTALLEGGSYPFSLAQLAAAQIDQAQLRRLESGGWLRTLTISPTLSFDIPHDRLLNWLIAAGMLDRLASEHETPEEFAQRLTSFLNGRTNVAGRNMGFVPMDSIWMMLHISSFQSYVADVLHYLSGYRPRANVLYNKMIPTLGEKVIQPLTLQLRRYLSDRDHAQLITRAITRIGGEKAIDAARQLLDDENPFLNRAALRILAEVPVPDVLDRIWDLQVAVKHDPTPFLTEHESEHVVLREGFQALCKCCVLCPSWIQEQIAAVGDGDPAAAILANLVAEVEGSDGKELWLHNKQALFTKVAPRTQRCLANCIDAHSDESESEWLVGQLSSTEDLVCSKALSVLARLKPDLAIEHLDKLPQRTLSSTPNWYANRLFALRKQSVQFKLLQMMRDGGPSWEIATVYTGREHLLDCATLRFLLDDLGMCLKTFLAESQTAPHEPALYSRLSLLASLGTIEQLNVFSERRGTPLATMLSDLLGRIGPKRGIWQDSLVRDPAFAILYRIGGEDYTYAVNRFLTAESQYARLDAVHRIARRPDQESVRLLEQIVASDNRWDGEADGASWEQNAAAEVLADIGEWESVIGLVSRFGLKTFSTITDLARQKYRPPTSLVVPVRTRVLSALTDASPGDVMALGIGGDPADSRLLREILERCAPESDMAHACVIGLELLEDQSTESVPLLTKVLPHQPFSASNALIANGSESAIQALWKHTSTRFEVPALINVLNRFPQSDEVISKVKEMIREQVTSSEFFIFAHHLEELLAHIESEEIINALLANEELQEQTRHQAFADETPFWVTGSKAACIRVLARFDRESAFRVARTALRNRDLHDRDFYPYIMMSLSEHESIPELLRQLAIEQDPLVARSICYALKCDGIDEYLNTELQSSDCSLRRSACLAAGWVSQSAATENLLTILVGDHDADVVDAAATAISHLRRRAECRKLSEAIVTAENSERRWRLLECLIKIGDPGDVHGPWPREGAMFEDVLSPLQLQFATEEIKNQRKAKEKQSVG